ncbi:MAG: hypothetical protein L6R35_006494, partial [Caloplaca aegaea]
HLPKRNIRFSVHDSTTLPELPYILFSKPHLIIIKMPSLTAPYDFGPEREPTAIYPMRAKKEGREEKERERKEKEEEEVQKREEAECERKEKKLREKKE